MPDDAALSRAKAALRSGERETARTLLLELTESRPEWADAWLWLAAASADPDGKRTYLERALRIDPRDSRAIAALRAMGHTPTRRDDSPRAVAAAHHDSHAAAAAAPNDSQPAIRHATRSAAKLPATDLLVPPRFSKTGVRARRLTWPLMALLAAIVVLIPLALTYLRA